MTNTSLADDLNQIANTVHILVQEESNKRCFQKHIVAFRKAMKTFDNALKEAKEAAIANPDLRYDYDEFRDKDKDSPKPPKEGYKVECHYVLDDFPKGFWRPPLPFNPEGYFQRFQCNLLGLFTREDKPRNQKQKLMCEFALIAAIRDEGLEIPACDRLTGTEKEDWVDSLWSLLSTEGITGDDYNTLPKRRRNINTAFVDVLANLPAGKGQEGETDKKTKQNGKDKTENKESKRVNSPCWVKYISQKQFDCIEKQYGPLAQNLYELAAFIREVDSQHDPAPSEGSESQIIAIPSLNAELGTVLYISPQSFGLTVRIHYSLLKQRTIIESLNGLDGSRMFYDELRNILSYTHSFIPPGPGRHFVWNGQDGKAEGLARTLEQWARALQTERSTAETSGDDAGGNQSQDLLKKKQSAIEGKDCWHNEDFTTVIWYGIEYQFNKTQARCIKHLWENNSASEKSIGGILDSAAVPYRLKDTFRSKAGYHCSWGKMIISAGKGCFKLNKP